MPSVHLSYRATRQLETAADPKYSLLILVRYSVIADGCRSCRSSQPHVFFLARAINYELRPSIVMSLLRATIHLSLSVFLKCFFTLTVSIF